MSDIKEENQQRQEVVGKVSQTEWAQDFKILWI